VCGVTRFQIPILNRLSSTTLAVMIAELGTSEDSTCSVEGCDAIAMHKVFSMTERRFACLNATHFGQVILDLFEMAPSGRFQARPQLTVIQAG
jgi:hypothetical protein